MSCLKLLLFSCCACHFRFVERAIDDLFARYWSGDFLDTRCHFRIWPWPVLVLSRWNVSCFRKGYRAEVDNLQSWPMLDRWLLTAPGRLSSIVAVVVFERRMLDFCLHEVKIIFIRRCEVWDLNFPVYQWCRNRRFGMEQSARFSMFSAWAGVPPFRRFIAKRVLAVIRKCAHSAIFVLTFVCEACLGAKGD